MVTLSLCMIVRNEEAVLRRILECMKGVADEIIVVDTGSEDKTKEIAACYTDRIYSFPWKQDFAAARNFACEKARMDYWMWLDADDMISEEQIRCLLKLKTEIDPTVDVVMMRYLTGFDEVGNVTFSYYRERWIRRESGLFWEGRVHEAVTPRGRVIYVPIEIEHRKLGGGDPDRNLNIYEQMLNEGEKLGARHQFYYGRELLAHGRITEARKVFSLFLENPDAWEENKIDACRQLAWCWEQEGKQAERLHTLLRSFFWGEPRAEICCEIGRYFMDQQKWERAIFWYRLAMEMKIPEELGGFVQPECRGYLPAIQLCVCFDRLGELEKARKYHNLASKYKPDAWEVRQNEQYFSALEEQGNC